MRQLESVVATAQTLGFWGAMYTVGGTLWLTPPSIWFQPRRSLAVPGHFWAGGALACAILELELASRSSTPSSVVTWPSSLVVSSPLDGQGERVVLLMWVVL